jgi:enoyl-CoA hydratase
MSNELVAFERSESVGVLTICNPPLNVITAEVRSAFSSRVDELRADPRLRVLIVTGAGDRSFCAGADLREEEGLDSSTVRKFLDEDRAVYDAMEELAIPVIAAVNGYCMGGGFELALACDIRIAAEEAKFCAAGVKIGLVVSTTRLTHLLGPAAAKDIALTARTFDGHEAVRLGVVSKAVPQVQLMEEAQAWAVIIAERAPLAVARTKQAIREAADLAFADAMNSELDHFVDLSGTEDHKHAIAAFFRREQPIFRGR